MTASAAKEEYGLRKQLVEPVFGFIKGNREHRGFSCAASPTLRPSGLTVPFYELIDVRFFFEDRSTGPNDLEGV